MTYIGVILGLVFLIPLFILGIFLYILVAHLVVISLTNIMLNTWQLWSLYNICAIRRRSEYEDDTLKSAVLVICGLII